MHKQTVFKDLGLIDYKKCWGCQEQLFNASIAHKNANRHKPPDEFAHTPNYLLFCEHPHVFTLGKSGSENNLLINFLKLNEIQASFYKINRGGDITYHGPGQIVAYPIIDIENFNLDIKSYVTALEEAVIRTLKDYNIDAERVKGATGVWLDSDNLQKVRKICAIGIKVSRYITMHGLAFNINTDLNYFSYINPCGFKDKAVTSLSEELGEKVSQSDVKEALKTYLSETIGLVYKK